VKRWFFASLIALLGGAWLFEKIASGSGYILIAFGNTAYEMSFWTGVGLLVGSLLVLLLTVWLVNSLIRVFGGSARRLMNVGRRNNQQRTARGLIDFIEGNWKQARHHLLKSVNQSETPMINYLAAARSTYELGNHKEATELLHLAQKSSPDSVLAVALTQARMLLVDKKYEQAMANLKRARDIAPHHPVVLELLYQIYFHLREWPALKELIVDLRRYKILEESEVQALEVNIYTELLIKAGGKGDSTLVDQQWENVPKALRRETPVFLAYVKQLIIVNDQSRAENLLRKQINQQWDDELINFYGRIVGKDPKRQLLFAKDWLQGRPGNANLLLAMGRLALANHQWQEARDYFYASHQLKKQSETSGELARLLHALGQTEEAAKYYQQALAQSAHALPNLPLPEPEPTQSPNLRVVKD
jgi:HemY protein